MSFLKANPEPFEDACPPQQIEANTQLIGKTHLGIKAFRSYLQIEIMQIDRNKSAITNLQIDAIPRPVVESDPHGDLSPQ